MHVLLIGLGTMVVPFDSAVNIAFPAITSAFQIPLPTIQWVVICYVLTHASLMLAFGRIGDLLRYDLVFRAGLLISTAAFLLCALAGRFEWLLAARVLQGVGAALVLSCGAALMTSLFPEERRSEVLGIYAMMFSLGSALGPVLGGVLVELSGWPGVFWFRAPFALAAFLLLRRVPVTPTAVARAPFDVLGAALLALALTTLLLGLTESSRGAGVSALVVSLLGTAGAGFAAFVWWESRHRSPLIDVRLFRSSEFSLLNASNMLLNLATFSVMLLVPYYLTRIAALQTIVAGLVLAAGPVAMAISASIGGRAIGRISADRVALGGAVSATAALALVAAASGSGALVLVVVGMLLQGFGTGLFQVAYLDIVTETMPREQRGVAGSLAMLTRTIGIVVAATTLSLVFASFEATSLAAGAPAPTGFMHGFRAAFMVATGVAALATTCMLLRERVARAASLHQDAPRETR